MDKILRKRIEELVKEEILIVPYDPKWPKMFDDELKRRLSEKYPNDRVKYTEGKSEFILYVTNNAMKYYESKN